MRAFVLAVVLILAVLQPAQALNMRHASADFLFATAADASPVELRATVPTDWGAVEIAHVQDAFWLGTDRAFASATEVGVGFALGPFRVGAGARTWVEERWRHGAILRRREADEVAAFLSVPAGIGPLALETHATYGQSGLGWLSVVGVDLSGLQLLAGYRHWPMEGWYSGPVLSIGVTF